MFWVRSRIFSFCLLVGSLGFSGVVNFFKKKNANNAKKKDDFYYEEKKNQIYC